MLKNNQYGYNDEYMNFTFDGIHSSEFNLILVNSGSLVIENQVGENTSYTNAQFQDGVYLTGTDKKQKEFKRKGAAEDVTLDQYRNLFKWLTPGRTGMLFFDNNPYWGYTVVLETAGNATIVETDNGLFTIQFDIVWKTIGSYLARNHYNNYSELYLPAGLTLEEQLNNAAQGSEYGIPVIRYTTDGSVKQVYIQSINNEFQNINFSYRLNTPESLSTNTLQISYDGKMYCYNKLQSTNATRKIIKLIGSANTLMLNNDLIEMSKDFISGSQPNGVLQLNSLLPQKTESTITKDPITLKIKCALPKEIFDKFKNFNYNYICFTTPADGNPLFDIPSSGSNFGESYNTMLFIRDISTASTDYEITLPGEGDTFQGIYLYSDIYDLNFMLGWLSSATCYCGLSNKITIDNRTTNATITDDQISVISYNNI